MILSTVINRNVLDEMKNERKITMVLQDPNVDNYIKMDMTEIDIYKPDQWKNSPIDL